MTRPTSAKKRDLTPQKTAFALWLVSKDREQHTQAALAVHLGVDAATLSDWKRDPLVVKLLAEHVERSEALWAEAYGNLGRIATQRQDNLAAITAIKELGKLLKKYPSEKVELTGKQGLLEWLGSTQQADTKRAN